MHIFIENYLKEMKISGDPSKALRYTQTESPPILLGPEKVPQRKIEGVASETRCRGMTIADKIGLVVLKRYRPY